MKFSTKLASFVFPFPHRSTKSEKLYPSVLSRGADIEIEPYYCLPVGSLMSNGVATNLTSKHGGSVGAAASVAWSQPTSPTPVNRQQQIQMNGPMSPTGGAGGLVVGQKLVYASMVPATGKKNDDGEWQGSRRRMERTKK